MFVQRSYVSCFLPVFYLKSDGVKLASKLASEVMCLAGSFILCGDEVNLCFRRDASDCGFS